MDSARKNENLCKKMIFFVNIFNFLEMLDDPQKFRIQIFQKFWKNEKLNLLIDGTSPNQCGDSSEAKRSPQTNSTSTASVDQVEGPTAQETAKSTRR